MRFVKLAAMAAGLSLSAASASAAVVMYEIEPSGPGNHFDFFFEPGITGPFSMDVSFDESAFATLNIVHTEYYSSWHRVCDGPNSSCFFSDDHLPSGGQQVTLDAPGALPPFGASQISQVNWTPTGHGFAMNFYTDQPCLTATTQNCLQLDKFFMLALSGTLKSDQPFEMVVTYGPAAPPAVPEPATWAMMIAGFGLVGSTLRRRRAITA